MSPGHVRLGMSHVSLPTAGTGTCPQCHTKCTSRVHRPRLLQEQGRVPPGHPALGTCPMCTVPPPCSSRDISPHCVSLGPRPPRDAEQGHVPMPHATGTHPCHVVTSHGTCPPPVRRPDGRGRPARGGRACGQAGGQRVPAAAPGPHLRPGEPAGFGRCRLWDARGGHGLGERPPPRGSLAQRWGHQPELGERLVPEDGRWRGATESP